MKNEPPFAHGTFLIDIGSHSIAAAHVSRNEHGLLLSGATRREFTREALDVSVIERRIAEHFPRLLSLMRERYGAVSEVVLCINGMFTISQTRTEDVVFDGHSMITPDSLRPAIQAGITHFFKEVLNDERNDFTSLDTALLATRLNGYEVTNPFGKRAHSAGVTIHISVAPRTFHSMLRRVIARELPQAAITMHASTYGLFRGLSESMNENDWMLVDTTGGLTELAFVEDGILRHIISLPDGGHSLVERVALHAGVDPIVMRSDLSLLAQGKLESKKAATLKTHTRIIGRELAGSILKTLDQPAGHPQLPNTVAVVAHMWARPILSAIWEDPAYMRATMNGDIPAHVVVDRKWLNEKGLYSEEGSRDVFLGLLALGISYFKSGNIVL
ncbi:MAG: hypothetical protein Q8P93_02630 [bacterium]|nr:hypothetical protein [bacterium]